MGIHNTPQDHPSKLLHTPSHKRKLDSPDPSSPPPKHPRLDLPSPRRYLHHHHHHRHHHHHHSSATTLAPPPADHHPDQPESQEEEPSPRRILPLTIHTIESGQEDGPGTQAFSIYTKGFFYVKGNDLRAGYWVYYRGHCVAKALVWNNEFNEIRYDHQGYEGCMAGMNKASVSPVTVGLMALLEAVAWARSMLPFARWHVYGEDVDALKLVDMYQRNSQFMRFHPERQLLDEIVSLAQAGSIHLHRR